MSKINFLKNRLKITAILAILIICGTWLTLTPIYANFISKLSNETMQPQKQVVLLTLTSNPSPMFTPMPTLTITPASIQVVKPTSQPSPVISLINCLGPDGKYSQKTRADCYAYNVAWGFPKPGVGYSKQELEERGVQLATPPSSNPSLGSTYCFNTGIGYNCTTTTPTSRCYASYSQTGFMYHKVCTGY